MIDLMQRLFNLEHDADTFQTELKRAVSLECRDHPQRESAAKYMKRARDQFWDMYEELDALLKELQKPEPEVPGPPSVEPYDPNDIKF